MCSVAVGVSTVNVNRNAVVFVNPSTPIRNPLTPTPLVNECRDSDHLCC